MGVGFLLPRSQPRISSDQDVVEILDLRHFRSSDLRSLLEEESRAWSRLLSWDYTGSAEMILRYMDARILPGYAWVENNLVQGYSFFVYEYSKAVIGDLFVHPSYSGRGQYSIEERLLGHVIETLQQSPGINRIEAQLLLHETATMERPFLEEGFRRHPRLFMVLPLVGTNSGNGNHLSQRLPDVEFRKWSDDDFQGAASVITTAYRDHIDSEINDQYRTSAGSLRFLNNIIRFPGCGHFDAEASIMARSRSTRAPLGVILCSRVRSDVGHVTQVCVAPEYRGRGLGQALLVMACNELQKRGCRALSLTVTEANAPAVNLYKRMGFTIHRIFDAFVWEG